MQQMAEVTEEIWLDSWPNTLREEEKDKIEMLEHTE